MKFLAQNGLLMQSAVILLYYHLGKRRAVSIGNQRLDLTCRRNDWLNSRPDGVSGWRSCRAHLLVTPNPNLRGYF